MTLSEARNIFPHLSQKVYGKELVYLDNAATSHRPRQVIDKWVSLSESCNSNIHRAVHHTADLATKEFEDARVYVQKYLNAQSPDEIIFTSGTTQSINLLAFSFGEAFIHAGDEIIIAESEHHSNIVPWQMLCERKAASIKVWRLDSEGKLDPSDLELLITPSTKLVCFAAISNVLGVLNPVKEIVNICHSKNCLVFTDGAQHIVHSEVDVQELGFDFYAFSGHKIYAAPGTGVLYGRRELLEKLPPYMGGGEMIDTVRWEKTTYAEVPHRFEAGTQNLTSVPTLIPALQTASMLRQFEDEQERIKKLVYDYLTATPGFHLYGTSADLKNKIPLFSFTVEGVHHEDLALVLDKMGVAVRSGQMCAEPLMDHFGVTGMLRASFAPYNTYGEAQYFIESLEKAIRMLR